MRFALGSDPLSSDEQRPFDADLREHGLDGRYWLAMNGLLTTRSRSDTPLVLRAYRADRLTGVAHLVECRRTNQCFFPGALGRVLDLVPMPMYCWFRGEAAVDLVGSPGFVADGEDRDAFLDAAIAYLNRRYPMGCVIEEKGRHPGHDYHETPFMDSGRYDVMPGGTEALLDAHKHLRRKQTRFRNKGGTLDIVTGALDPGDRDAVLHCLRQSAGFALVRTPFQENYANMVRWAAESGSAGVVHVIARLEQRLVGYHAFLHAGQSLQCLSGGFDRTRQTTYHAYENILLEAMRYAEAHCLTRVSFGPIGNPSKAAVMPAFGQFVVRLHSRFAFVRRMLALLIPHTAIRPATFEAYSGLAARRGEPASDTETEDPARPDGVVSRRPVRA
jgi:hypothetical protein